MQALAYSLGYGIVRARTVKHGKLDEIIGHERFGPVQGRARTASPRSGIIRWPVDIDEHFVTSRSKNDGTVMSIEDRERKFFGVQFHPESILSEFGAD